MAGQAQRGDLIGQRLMHGALDAQHGLCEAIGRGGGHTDRGQGRKGRPCCQRSMALDGKTILVCRFFCFRWGRSLFRVNGKRTLAGLCRPISSRVGQSARLRTRIGYHIRCISVDLAWGPNHVWLRCAAERYRTTQGCCSNAIVGILARRTCFAKTINALGGLKNDDLRLSYGDRHVSVGLA
jgi:hypothetical protein